MSAVTLLFFFFSFPPLSLLGWGRSREQQLDSSLRPECCGVVDSCWHGFLPISASQPSLDDVCDAAGFLPARSPGLFETYRGFVLELITCLQEICLHKLDGWYACATFGCKGFTALFLSLQPDTPPTELSGDLGFVSEVNQTCACSKFADSFKQ